MTIPVNVLVLWLLPVSWLIHDLEEIATIDRWSRRWDLRESDDLTSVQRRLVGAVASTRRRFTIAVAFVGCVVFGATVAGVLDPNGVGIRIYTTILGGYFLHAFVHVGQAVVFRGYTPGLVTAVLGVIPVSASLYRRLLSVQLVDIGTVTTTGLLGLVLSGSSADYRGWLGLRTRISSLLFRLGAHISPVTAWFEQTIRSRLRSLPLPDGTVDSILNAGLSLDAWARLGWHSSRGTFRSDSRRTRVQYSC